MREITNINKNWLFSKKAVNPNDEVNQDNWEKIDLPHTWNGKDGQDGGNDYYRGKCFYAKSLSKDLFADGEIHYLEFKGVNSTAEVFFNGELLTTHHGGYSTFRVKLPEIKDKNLLIKKTDGDISHWGDNYLGRKDAWNA